MKKINNYIIEKLKINKDSKTFDYDKIKSIIKDALKDDIDSTHYEIEKFEFTEGDGLIIQFKHHINEFRLNTMTSDIEEKFNNENINYITIRFSEDKKQIAILLEEN